jgi:hypothetical protein
MFVPVNIRTSYRFCHTGSVFRFGASTMNWLSVRSLLGSFITGRPALTNAFRFAGHPDGVGLNNVSIPIASPDH